MSKITPQEYKKYHHYAVVATIIMLAIAFVLGIVFLRGFKGGIVPENY
jgi:hypothetical protein